MRSKIFIFAAMVVASLALIRPAHATSQATGLIISPATATITADQTQVFVVTTTNADGTTTNVTSASTLSVNDPLGSMSGATYTAGKAGTWTVQASYQSFGAAATMTITAGVLAELDINPNSDPEFTTIGKTRKFTVDGFDQDKNSVSAGAVAWSVIGDIGTITAKGVFTPSAVGTGKVQAQSGTITSQIAVVVSEAPAANTNANVNATTTNTNRAVNANVSKTNTNTAVVNTAVVKVSDLTADDNLQCTTLKSWLWILMLVVTLVAVFILYALVPATKYWPVVAALVGAGVLTFIQRKYGCGGQSWWAWVMILGAVAISLLALRRNTPKGPAQPIL